MECDIHKTVNQHFTARISGYTKDSTEEVIRKGYVSDQVSVYAVEEGERLSIFLGTVGELKISMEGQMRKLTILVQSNTCRLDDKKYIRFFQNPEQSYKDIVEFIRKRNERTAVIYFTGRKKRTRGIYACR